MARTAFTATQKSTFRAFPQRTEVYAAIHQPRVVWMGALSDVPTTYTGSAITAKNTASGNLVDVKAGMTMRVGTEPVQSDLGIIRVRKAPTATSIIGTAEYGSGLINWKANACLTVIEEYRPWPIHHSYDTANSRWLVDFDTFTSQLVRYGPMALMGPPAVAWIDSNKVLASYVGDRSYSFTGGASITSQTWSFPNGDTVTSLLGSSLNPVIVTYLNASSGGAYHTLTVTDGNGNSHIGQRLTFAFNASNAQPIRVSFEEISGGLRQGGYRGRFYAYSGATSDNFPEQSQVVIFEKASYNGIASSLGGNYFGRENILMVGWIAKDSVDIEPFTGNVSFEVETIDGLLNVSDAYDIFLESGSAASAWTMASGLTIDRAAICLTKYRSTIANVTDVNLMPSIASSNEILFQSLPAGSLWTQLRYNYADRGMMGIVSSDLQSSIYATLDAQIDGGSASLPLVTDISSSDRRDRVTIEQSPRESVSRQVLYAVSNTTPLGAESPGTLTGYMGGRQEVSRGLTVDTQDRLITWAGNLRARENNNYKRIVIPLSGNIKIDSVPQCRVTMSLSPTGATNLRGINWINKTLLPYETRLTYNATGEYLNTEITAEASVDGIGGSAITFPTVVTPTPPPIPVITPAPGGTPGSGDTVYVATNKYVARTTNFSNSSPSWKNITGAISEVTIWDLILDPYDPKNTAYACTSSFVWKTTNLASASPLWTKILTITDYIAAGQSPRFYQLRATAARQNRIYVLANTNPVNWNRAMFRTDNGGTTWNFYNQTGILAGAINPTGGYAIDVGQHDSTIVYLTGRAPTTSCRTIWKSTDSAATFSIVLGSDAGNGSVEGLSMPYIGNESDSDFYMLAINNSGCSNPNGSPRSYIGGVETTFPETDLSPKILPHRIQVFTYNNKQAYFFKGLSATADDLYFTGDGGVTIEKRYGGLGASVALGIWPYDINKIFLIDQTNGIIYYSSNGGASLSNKNGDWTTSIGTSPTDGMMVVPVWIT